MFAHQLTRGVVRTRVVESLADITVLVVAVVALAGLDRAAPQGNGETMTLAVVGAHRGRRCWSATSPTRCCPRRASIPSIDRGLPAVVAGVVAGGVVGYAGLRRN